MNFNMKKHNIGVPFVSIILAMLVGAVAMLLAGYNPVSAYASFFDGIFSSPYLMGETIRQVTPLIFTGLAVAFAFRTGLFNIGAEGQFLVGQLAAVAVGIFFKLPFFLHIPLAILAAAIAGGLWGAIPGYLKAKRGVHEVITTIMMNWIAFILTNYLIRTYMKAESERSMDIQPTASISFEWLSDLFQGARIHLGIVIALLFAFLMYFLLWRTKQGFELRAVGSNSLAAKYAGMNVKRNIIKAMFISGALAGLGGASEGLGVYGYMTISSVFPGVGYDGIAVALIGSNTSIGVILGAILFGALTFGAQNMQMASDVPYEIIRIVIAFIIFFIASSDIAKSILGLLRKIPLRSRKGGA
ncbi:ABC transporter permease [Paenibacillus fonticola]|uniref:ABC transporter permease n=1 Tax=Paenibacillus fonticola TaxID=379896 RepID=UPI0003645DA8|nr:ABC transporter permease [Paenibacillus fonticola]